LQKKKQLNICGIAGNCTELRAAELLFYLKINNFNCDLKICAADSRMELNISVDFKIMRPKGHLFRQFSNFKVSCG